MVNKATFPTQLGFYLAGIATAVLVAIIGWLLLQQPSSAGVPALSPANNREFSGLVAAPSTAVQPVDRKLLDEGYWAIVMGRGKQDPLADVNPADRKFFTNAYPGWKGGDPLAHVDPADRKFYTNRDIYGR
jgi:hypothetical protein